MIKWEYLFVRYYYDVQRRGQHVNLVNNQSLENLPPLLEYCNQLGEQGWELIVECETGDLIFKRPKVEGALTSI